MTEGRKIVLILEYNGANYAGFQYQKGQPTVQEKLEEAIYRLTGEKIRIIGASRTDSGVHALGQVVSFRTGSRLPKEAFVRGLNYHLPRDIAVREAYAVAEPVNIRSEAISREYHYHILNRTTPSPLRSGFSYLVREVLDADLMNEACRMLLGEHDFTSFASSLTGTRLKSGVRKVYQAEVTREKELVVFKMVANSFLPHQVRSTVGSLIRVGLRKMSTEDFYSIIGAKKPGLAGPLVPARGLFLIRVNYPYSFEDK
ncbi:MAG: tRNA pseudouridine(38-40) synthase TruA [Chloroflexota bacterium]